MNVSKNLCNVEKKKILWIEWGVWGVFCKNIFFRWFMRKSVFIWNIVNFAVKNSENRVKVDVSEELCDGEWQLLFQMKQGYKASCVKTLIFCQVTRRMVFIWNIGHIAHREK